MQISRNPDKGAACLTGDFWTMHINAEPVPKLSGMTIEAHLNWQLELEFKDDDIYTWASVGPSYLN